MLNTIVRSPHVTENTRKRIESGKATCIYKITIRLEKLLTNVLQFLGQCGLELWVEEWPHSCLAPAAESLYHVGKRLRRPTSGPPRGPCYISFWPSRTEITLNKISLSSNSTENSLPHQSRRLFQHPQSAEDCSLSTMRRPLSVSVIKESVPFIKQLLY